MKKSSIALLVVLTVATIFLSSYENGPARHSGYNCSGSESGFSNPTGCSTGSCHGNTATPGIVVTIAVIDSAGDTVTSYRGGRKYTVKLTGTNTTTNSEPYFGFQLTAITGSTAVVTPANAGTWQQSNLPAGVQYEAAVPGHHVANVIEQGTALSAASGTGAAGTVYTVAVGWTAPVTGTGTVSFWAALNAVDGIDVATGFLDFWNTQSLVLAEDTSTATTGVMKIDDGMTVNIYPNPSTDFVQVELDNAMAGAYIITAYDVEGRKLLSNNLQSAGNYAAETINTSKWASGIYMLQITNGSMAQVVRVVKK